MKNSVEIIMNDIKKLFKELEDAYGDIKPQVCDVTSASDSCTNKKCWVNRSRNDFFDKMCDFRKIITDLIDLIEENPTINSDQIKSYLKTSLNKVSPEENDESPEIAIRF